MVEVYVEKAYKPIPSKLGKVPLISQTQDAKEYAAINRTRITAHESAINEIKTIYTVPINTVFYLAYMNLNVINYVVGTGYGEIQDNFQTEILKGIAVCNTINLPAIVCNLAVALSFPLKFVAGEVITLRSSGANITAFGIIHGWLEPA